MATKITNDNITSMDAGKLTGSLPGGMAPETDLSTVRSDILKLAIHQAIDGNRVAYNLEDSFVDGFEDDTGITTEADVDRDVSGEYVSSSSITIDSNTLLQIESNTTDGSTTFVDGSPSARTITVNGDTQHDTSIKKTGNSSMLFDGSGDYLSVPDSDDFAFSGDHTIEAWIYPTSIPTIGIIFGTGVESSWASMGYLFYLYGGTGILRSRISNNGGTGMTANTGTAISLNVWTHVATVRSGNTWTWYVNGTSVSTVSSSLTVPNMVAGPTIGADTSGNTPFVGNMDALRVSNIARYSGNFTPATGTFGQTVNATGTLISDPQTASTSRTSASGVIIYEDALGTNTLGTDLKIYFSCDNSTWTEAASYGTATTYSGTKKLVKLGATTCTAGTAIAMKAEWANQSGSKEARLHGWAVNY